MIEGRAQLLGIARVGVDENNQQLACHVAMPSRWTGRVPDNVALGADLAAQQGQHVPSGRR
jgi:hypothetical protein